MNKHPYFTHSKLLIIILLFYHMKKLCTTFTILMNSVESEDRPPIRVNKMDANSLDKKRGEGNDLVSGMWNQVCGWMKNVEKRYTEWISEDLEWTTKMEAGVRAVSYLMTLGRSEIVSELMYSLANLMVLFNDSMLLSALRRQRAQPILKRVLLKALAILENFQVCLEMVARRYLGERWKWAVITFISLFKSFSKAVLVFYFRSGLSHCQNSQPIDRQLLANGKPQMSGNEEGEERGTIEFGDTKGKAWVGSRTNKVVRSIHDDMSRSYDELKESYQGLMGVDETKWSVLSEKQLLGESINIAKPLAHLLSIAVFGEKSLKSLFIPLCMDLISLHLIQSKLKLSELREITRRKIGLLYYLLRSPVYDNYVKVPLLGVLGYFANRIPLFGRLIEHLIIYLPTWQSTYFYVWAS